MSARTFFAYGAPLFDEAETRRCLTYPPGHRQRGDGAAYDAPCYSLRSLLHYVQMMTPAFARRHPDRQLWRYGLEKKPRGFRVLPRRWVVERTFSWLGQARRLAKDFERLPETAVAMIHAAMSRIMLRRLARAAC